MNLFEVSMTLPLFRIRMGLLGLPQEASVLWWRTVKLCRCFAPAITKSPCPPH
jgi:hypothetical protein